ncbi:phosphate/phosphite/phosphonate ABC transporter substrate-binding protein [Roseovarius phycicola]|uniref:PhnD/SsuA/transferrin family substrate-binding protein n=1 Tax=Roseovarius phycicola TaxID=3080976 RepID=A0ABZ2HEN0_9RHOB
MIASLPMYDRHELQAANDRLWHAVRENLGFGPDSLKRDGDIWEHWMSPDLLLSQTCGFPYRARLHGAVQLVGTPDNRLEGCAPGEYCSVFVARADELRDQIKDYSSSVFAYNEPLSQSGWAAAANYGFSRGFSFARTSKSGGHLFSAKAVAEGRADLAAIDALTWRHIQRYDDFAAQLRVVAHTDPTPTLPFITARDRDLAPIRDALAKAIADLREDDRESLSLYGLVDIPAERYLSVRTPVPPSS